MGSFGDKFRNERERREMTLDDVSNVTKISSRMLKAIEEERFDLLPGGVFNKGFIRAYAKHLGLNDEDAVNEYLAALRQAQIEEQSAAWNATQPSGAVGPAAKPPETNPVQHVTSPRKSTAANRPAETPSRPTAAQEDEPLADRVIRVAPRGSGSEAPRRASPWKLGAIAVSALLVLTILIWNRHSRSARADGVGPAESETSNRVASNPVEAHPTLSTGAQQPKPVLTSNGTTTTRLEPASAQTALRPTTEAHAISTPDQPVSKPALSAATAKLPAAPVPPTFTIQIRASETSWVAVTADGQLVRQETLIAPAEISVHASHEIVIKAGNAAGVSFLMNGKEIPTQGAEAEVKTFTFDSQGLHTLSPNQPAEPIQ